MGYCRIMKNTTKGIKMNTTFIKNDKMNKDTYKLRSRVMELIYEALDYGIKLPDNPEFIIQNLK